MIRLGRTAESIAAFCSSAGIALFLASPVSAAGWAGRPLAEALAALHAPGFSVIFSSELVPDSLRVSAEPRAGTAAETAQQLLQPFGLGLKNVAPGVFAVVRAEQRALAAANSNRPGLAAGPIEQVIIAASRYRLEGGDAAHHLARSDISNQPKFADDPLRVVARLPGVTNNGESALLNIRGGSSDEVLFLVDGFPVRQAYHVPGHQAPFSAFDAALISTIEVYTGGFPLRYGERMSGVVDMQTLEPRRPTESSIGASNIDVSARTAGALSSSWDGLIAARTGHVDNLMDRLASDVQTPTFADGLAKLRWHPTDSSAISAETVWSQDHVALRDASRGEFARLTSHTYYLWLRGQQQFSDAWQAQGWLGYSALHSLREGQVDNPGIVTGDVADQRSSDLWDARWQLRGALSDSHAVEFGGEWHRGHAVYAYRSSRQLAPEIAQLYGQALSSSVDTAISPYQRQATFYWADRDRLGGRATLEWGTRLERVAGLGLASTWLWDPRAMVSVDLGERTRLRASWGRFHQADSVEELHVEDGEVGFSRPQRSDHVILGLEHNDRRGIVWRAELYDKQQAAPRPRYENQLNPLSILPELEPDRVRIAPSGAELRGLEVSAAYSSSAWTWQLNYDWSKATDQVGGVNYLRSWDQPHSVNATLDWRNARWSFGSALSAHSGWPTTRLQYDAAVNPILGPRNGARWPYYASLDLRGAYRLPLQRSDVLFALDLANALDRQNRCCSELVAPPEGLAIEPLTLLPFTATASVRWNF